MHLESIKLPVLEHFKAVDNLLAESMHSKASIINDLSHYIIDSGGKRLRPLVVLLIAKACGYNGEQHIDLAAVIEFIHTATLLHDDVVDDSDNRRGRKTANSVWGKEAAVLVGDYLYSKAFQMLVNVGNVKVMEVLANATNIMAEGEALQLLDRHNPDTTEEAYLNVIRSKTAKLFEASAEIGAILANNSIETIATYGLHLGMAFQLIDDVLDYEADPKTLGKDSGNDLSEGKVTLPLIYLLQKGNPKEIDFLKAAIKKGGKDFFPVIRDMVIESGALQYTKEFAKIEVEKAKQALSSLKPSPYKEAALNLAEFALARDH